MRLQTFVKNNGGYTKKEVMSLYEKGLILVNGKVCNLSYNIKEDDVITINNEIIKDIGFVYYLYNKPKGVVCTNDRSVPHNILDEVKVDERVYAVGRLDKDTHGLIIITNDNKLTHYVLESNDVTKEYIVKVKNKISDDFLRKMEERITIHGKLTDGAKTKKIDDYSFYITLSSGRYHEIRTLVKNASGILLDLKRIRIGKVCLDSFKLEEGKLIKVRKEDII